MDCRVEPDNDDGWVIGRDRWWVARSFRKNFPRFHPPPSRLAYTAGIPSREGALSGPPGPRGEGTAPAPVGARQARRLRGKRTRSSRGSPPPPLRHYDRSAQWGLKKCGMETFRRRVGAPVRRDFTLQRLSRRSLTPRPVPGQMSGRRIGHGRNRRQAGAESRDVAPHHSPLDAGTTVAPTRISPTLYSGYDRPPLHPQPFWASSPP
jgi:hypothetical protein